MSLNIKHKRSGVNGSAPSAAQLEDGELAVNYNDIDPAIYIKDSAGGVVRMSGVGAVGTNPPPPPASETVEGIAEIATQTEVDAGTDDSRIVTPLKMAVNAAANATWLRTGSELSPKTAGDDVFTSGDVKVGGTTGGPNISLNAGGSIFAGLVSVGGDIDELINLRDSSGGSSYLGATVSGKGDGLFGRGDEGAEIISHASVSSNRNIQFKTGADKASAVEVARLNANGLYVGGTLPSAPNLQLDTSGSAQFTGTIAYQNTSPSPGTIAFQVRDGSTAVFRVYADGETVIPNIAYFGGNTICYANGDLDVGRILAVSGSAEFSSEVKIGGTLPSLPNISLKIDGSAQFAGDVEVTTNTAGLILSSPNGTRYRLTVDDAGVLSTVAA